MSSFLTYYLTNTAVTPTQIVNYVQYSREENLYKYSALFHFSKFLPKCLFRLSKSKAFIVQQYHGHHLFMEVFGMFDKTILKILPESLTLSPKVKIIAKTMTWGTKTCHPNKFYAFEHCSSLSNWCDAEADANVFLQK